MIFNAGTGTSLAIAVAASAYLLLQSEKFFSRKVPKRREINEFSESCSKCKSKVEEVKEDSSTVVTCKGCGSLVGEIKCSQHSDVIDNWRCKDCRRNSVVHHKPGEWFLRQLRDLTDLNSQCSIRDNILTINPSNAIQIKIRLEKVRELTEQYLSKILNGSLEDTLVGKISNDVECLPNPNANANHNDLKRFINRICQEVVNISNSIDAAATSTTENVSSEHDDKLFASDPKTYEQLVATAVLNKITENYHQNRNLFDVSSDDTNLNKDNEATPDDDHIMEDFEQFQSQVQNRPPTLPNMFDKDYEFSNDDGSWEDNWFFKITKLNTEPGICMLVPSPSDDSLSRPLIGDKAVDQYELSDETSSELSNFEYENFENYQKDEISTTSVNKNLIVELPTIIAEKKQTMNENVTNDNDKNQIDKINNDVNDDKEIKLAAIKVNSIESLDEALFESTINENDEKIDKEFEEILMNESYIVPGSIAEREKIKWLNAPPIENNPYSSEALKKRLSKLKMKDSFDVSTDSTNHTPQIDSSDDDDNREAFQLREDIRKYKRDYYINNKNDENYDVLANGVHEPSTPKIISSDFHQLSSPKIVSNNIPKLSTPKIADEQKITSPKIIQHEFSSPKMILRELSSSKSITIDSSKVISSDVISNDSLIMSNDDQHSSDLSTTNTIIILNDDEQQPSLPKSNPNDLFENYPTKIISSDNDEILEILNFETTPAIDDDDDDKTAAQIDEIFSSLTMNLDENGNELNDEKVNDIVHGVKVKEIVENHKELITCETYEEKQVIEPEVVEFLPSVKKLAKLYSHEDDIEASEQHDQVISKTTSENKVYSNININPLARPVASITARSLPTKVRTELKKSLTEDEISHIPVVSHSERTESPDIESGVTRKSIAYFEKLYT